MASTEINYAFYSAQAAEQFGTLFWRAADGTEVELTCVTPDPEGSSYLWDDKENRGQVVCFVRDGRKGTTCVKLAI